MIKKALLLNLIILFIGVSSYAQMESNQKAKLYFQEAQKWFNQNEYDDAMNYIFKAEQTLGGTNGRILNLKIKTLYNQGKFIEAEDALMLFSGAYENSVTEELKNDTYSYFVRIDKASSAIKEKLAEEERIKEEARLKKEALVRAKQKQIDDASVKITPQINKTHYTFAKLEEGKPYLVTYRKTLTSSTSEKAYFIFYGSKYIICTVPSMSIFENLDKEKVEYNSYNAGSDKNVISASVKSDYGGKKDVSFRKSVNYSNIYMGGNGDELLWTKGTQNRQFEKRLHYYYYKNALSVDTTLKEAFQEHYYNPYIETGRITKTVDYDLVKDTKLFNALKNKGVANKKTTNYSSPLGLEIKLVPSKSISMLFPSKKVTYYLKDEINKYTQNGNKYKGTLLYYGVKTKSNNYARIQYTKSYPKKELLNAVTGLTNTFVLKEDYFNSIYDSFSKDAGNGKTRYFTNSKYDLPYWTISKIATGTKISLESLYGSYTAN